MMLESDSDDDVFIFNPYGLYIYISACYSKGGRRSYAFLHPHMRNTVGINPQYKLSLNNVMPKEQFYKVKL